MKRLPLVALLALTVACHRAETPAPRIGDPVRGKELIDEYGCIVCHQIPGFQGGGTLGPSLQGFASRPLFAKKIPNTPENIVKYVESPASLDPTTRMPGLNLPRHEVRDIAAYLLTLK